MQLGLVRIRNNTVSGYNAIKYQNFKYDFMGYWVGLYQNTVFNCASILYKVFRSTLKSCVKILKNCLRNMYDFFRIILKNISGYSVYIYFFKIWQKNYKNSVNILFIFLHSLRLWWDTVFYGAKIMCGTVSR